MNNFIEDNFDLLEIRRVETPFSKKPEYCYATLVRAAGLSGSTSSLSLEREPIATGQGEMPIHDSHVSQAPPALPDKPHISTSVAGQTVRLSAICSRADSLDLTLSFPQPKYCQGEHMRSISITPTITSAAAMSTPTVSASQFKYYSNMPLFYIDDVCLQ